MKNSRVKSHPSKNKQDKDPVFATSIQHDPQSFSQSKEARKTENNLKWKGKLNPANMMILYVENPTRLIEKLKYSGRRHCQAVPSQNRSQCSSNRFQQGVVSKVLMLTAAEERIPPDCRGRPGTVPVFTPDRAKAGGTEFGTSSTATCRQPFNTQIFNQDKTG